MLKIRKIFFLSLFFLCLFQSQAQRIQNFYLVLSNNQVGIRFTFTKGSTSPGYTIYWSSDSLTYSPIYNYVGTCGDANVDMNYNYTHASPIPNQLNYYKVEVTGIEMSPPKSIYVSYTNQKQNRMLVYPDPLTNFSDKITFRIYNVNNLHVVGFLYNQFGKPLRPLDVTTQGEVGDIFSNDLENGLYMIWLTDGTVAYSGKFIVLR